jgi:hypothetical protein
LGGVKKFYRQNGEFKDGNKAVLRAAAAEFLKILKKNKIFLFFLCFPIDKVIFFV